MEQSNSVDYAILSDSHLESNSLTLMRPALVPPVSNASGQPPGADRPLEGTCGTQGSSQTAHHSTMAVEGRGITSSYWHRAVMCCLRGPLCPRCALGLVPDLQLSAV